MGNVKYTVKKKVDKINNADFKTKVLGGLPVNVYVVYINEDDWNIKLYDRKGYRAKWIENKLSEPQWEDILLEAIEYQKQLAIDNFDEPY